jgi:DNA polymerase-3 subunit delta
MAKGGGTQAHYDELVRSIKARKFAPVYYLYGEEEYFTDRLAVLLEEHVLAGAEPSFNLDLLYGPDVNMAALAGLAKSFPVMASHRLVLVREANKINKTEREKLGDFLVHYLEKPPPSTVLVFVQKDKSGPDKRTKLGKTLAAKAELFESKPLYDNQVPAWVTAYVHERGYSIDPDALQIVVASLGTDLKLIASELGKIEIQLQTTGRKNIDKNLVYEFIQVDKEFNVFELQNRIGARQVYAAHLTLDHMLRNAKANPPVVILGQLSGFFTKLGILKSEKAETDARVAQVLGIHEFIAKNYVLALRNYSYGAILAALKFLQEADFALKGINNSRMDETHVMKTLLYNLLQRA